MKSYLDDLRPFERRLVVGVAAMLFVVLNVAFVFPHFADWKRMQNRMLDGQWTLDRFAKEIGQMPAYTNQIASLIGESQDVPAENQAAEFSRAVARQAAESLVSMVGTQPMSTKTNQFFLELSQNLSVQSREEHLVDFLYRLGSGSSVIRVRGLTLRPDVPRQTLNANVTLVASYQKNAPAPTAPKGLAPAAKRPAAASTPAPATGKKATSTSKSP
jgi:hypothetical protein